MGHDCAMLVKMITHRVGHPSLSIVQEHPVVHAILDLASVLESLGEEVPEEVVVRSLLESELADVVEVDGELLCVWCGRL